jgi:hypothetical protein
MSGDEILAIIITAAVLLPLLIISVILLCGKGAFMIAGFNTMPKDEKEKYDIKKLCKFIGLMLLLIIFCSAGILAGTILTLGIVIIISTAVLLAAIVFTLIFANTKDRFKK